MPKKTTRKPTSFYRQPPPRRLKKNSGRKTKTRAFRDEQITIPYTLAKGISREAQPFLKWVGGKSQLLAQFDRFFPTQIDRYIEPFVGGGAVFFHLKHRFPTMKAFLRDNNDELINAYIAVRDYPLELMSRFDPRQSSYYRQAAEFLGLVSSDKEHNYVLTDLGREYSNLPADERRQLLAGILAHFPPMRAALEASERAGERGMSKNEIAALIERNSKIGASTPSRRASTLLAWLRWLQSKTGAVQTTEKGFSLR